MSRFIPPVSSSSAQSAVQRRQEPQDFQRFKSKDKKQPSKDPEKKPRPKLQAVPDAKTPAAPPTQAGPGSSVSSTFLQLLQILRRNNLFIQQWLGRGAYHQAQKEAQASAKFRKGAMLDRKAE